MAAVDDHHLPVLVDGDNGYGDAKTAVHVLHTYERMGAGAIFFEDQVSPKRCGHMAGKQLMPPERMAANLRAVSGERMRPDTFIIARTDARELHGLDEALRRGERYLRAGADGLFIEAPASLEELARVGGAFAGVPQLANMLEGGRTPLLPPAELGRLGFSMAIYGISLLMHATRAMQGVLAELARGGVGFAGRGTGFKEYKDMVGFDQWSQIESRYG
jgi:2,3-dimethylmalate lyase